MSISTLKYQPVDFRTTEEIEQANCGCATKPFCQLVNKNDATQFQLKSTNLIENGTFDTDLEDWVIGESLTIEVGIANESTEGACDGELDISVSGGTGPYEYSIDGVTFQSSNLFENLCVGCYSIVVKDSLDNTGFATGCVDTNIDCSLYAGADIFDMLDLDISTMLNCYINDLL